MTTLGIDANAIPTKIGGEFFEQRRIARNIFGNLSCTQWPRRRELD